MKNIGWPTMGSYVFTASLPEGYLLADDTVADFNSSAAGWVGGPAGYGWRDCLFGL